MSAGLATVLTALIAAGIFMWRSSEPSQDTRRLELTIPRVASLKDLSLSPDGRHLAFIGAGPDKIPAVWLRGFSDSFPQLPAGTQGADPDCPPFWLPGGHEIAFVADGRLRRTGLPGGQPQAIADVTNTILGGAWAEDGSILLGTYRVSDTHGIHRIAATGGAVQPWVPFPEGVLAQALPKFLPDGRRFAFTQWVPDERGRDVCVASLDDPAAHCLGLAGSVLVGVTDRYLVHAQGNTLFASPFDSGTAALAGAPRVVAEGLESNSLGQPAASVSGHSILVYQPKAPERRQFVWLDRHGSQLGVVGSPEAQGRFDVSDDGATLAVERTDGTTPVLWLIDTVRGLTARVEIEPTNAPALSPLLSRDGRWLTYLTSVGGRVQVVTQATQGGDRRVLFDYSGEGIVYLTDRSEATGGNGPRRRRADSSRVAGVPRLGRRATGPRKGPADRDRKHPALA